MHATGTNMIQPGPLVSRLREVLAAPTGLAGTLLLFGLFVGRAIGWAGDIDFIAQHWTSITPFLQGWGMLIGMLLGAALIAKAIYDTSHIQPQPHKPAAHVDLIDPWLPEGRRTFVRMLIDQSNWRASALKKENVYEVKATYLDPEKTAVQLVIIFQRWTVERGAHISADNRLETYRTAEEAMTVRYAIYTIHGIKSPCIIDVEFQSGVSPPEDEELTPPPRPNTEEKIPL